MGLTTEPRIYTKNYINTDDTVTVSSGQSSITNAYDRDTTSQWSSQGATNSTVTINVTFYEGSVPVTRQMDTFLLINHNLKDYNVSYVNGLSNVVWLNQHNDTTQSTIVNQYNASAYGNVPVSMAVIPAITTTGLIINANTTQVPLQEKVIGEMVSTNLLLSFGMDVMKYSPKWRQRVNDLPMGDGTVRRATVKWTPNRYEKYQASVAFDFISNPIYSTFYTAIKQMGNPVLWYPETNARPDEIWYCHIQDPRTYSYVAQPKTAGTTLSFTVEEV